MSQIKRCIGMGAVVAILYALPPSAVGQERPAGAGISPYLVPFIELSGVRFELTGLDHMIENGPPAPPGGIPPIFPQAEQEALERRVLSDANDAFRRAGIPMLPLAGPRPDTRPRLVISVGWQGLVGTDQFSVRGAVQLLEAARLVRNQDQIVWSATWGEGDFTQSTGAELPTILRRTILGEVDRFIILYTRAHAEAGAQRSN